MSMVVIVNDQEHTLPEPLSVSALLVRLGLDKQPCAVEVNRKLVPKLRHPLHDLVEGDKVEVVTLVGGG